MLVKTLKGKEIISKSESSILDTALSSGLVFEYSCKNGQCGVCKTTLIEGEVEELQPQIALSEIDVINNQILTCCCSPITDVLIDAEDLSALKGIDIKTLPVRISKLDKLNSEIVKVVLRFPPAAQFKFLEGQYIDVVGKEGLRRSYSIASPSSKKEITLFIKRFENGQMSNFWFNQAAENDLLRIEGPKGTFFLRNLEEQLVFLATGTGIAPIISILERLDADPDFQQTQTISLYWGNRNPEEFVWTPDFKKISVDLNLVLSNPVNDWQFARGYVQDVAIQQQADLNAVAVYACGSNAMIQDAKRLFTESGLQESKFYSDAFVQSY